MKTFRSILIHSGLIATTFLATRTEAFEYRWQDTAMVPSLINRFGFTLTEFKSKLWVIGGVFTGSPTSRPAILRSADGKVWDTIAAPSAFRGREGHAAVVFQDTLYVLGGKDSGGTVKGDIWKSSDGINWFQSTPAAPFGPRYNHAAVVHNGQIWVMGGMGTGDTPRAGSASTGTKTIDAWVSSDGITWRETLSPDFPPRQGHQLASFEGNIWVVGGKVWNGTVWGETNKVYNGPITQGHWRLDSIPSTLNFAMHGLITQGDGLYVFGGGISVEGTLGPVELRLNSSGTWDWLLFADYQPLSFGEYPNYTTYANSKIIDFQDRFISVGNTFNLNPQVLQSRIYYSLTLNSQHGHIDFKWENTNLLTFDSLYLPGTNGALIPVADSGYTFIGWSGDAEGTSTLLGLTIDRDKSITALFQPANPVITVTISGSGGASPGGASVSVPRGASQTFSFRSFPGSRLTDVFVDAESQGPISSFTFDTVVENHTLRAVFTGCPERVNLKPNYVVFKTYSNDGGAPVKRYVVPDGFGEAAQTQLEMGGGEFLLSGDSRDGIGLATREVKPYLDTSSTGFAYEDMSCDHMIVKSNAYYNGTTDERPDAQGYAYTERRYATDPSSRLESAGLPGKPFSLDPTGGHPIRLWRFGALDSAAFLSASALIPAALDARVSPDSAQYRLTVSMDGNGNFTQVMQDAFGNIVAKWNNPYPAYDTTDVTSKAEYDVLNRLTREVPPLGAAYATLEEESGAGEALSDSTPDGGKTEYRHDPAGRLRFIRTSRHRSLDSSQTAFKHFLILSFDAKDRLTAISENRGNHPFDSASIPLQGDSLVRKAFLYDTLRLSDLQAFGLGATTQALTAIAAEATVPIGQLALAVAQATNGSRNAVAFSYEARGLLKAAYRILPGNAPVQKTTYAYDLEGKPVKQVYFNGYGGTPAAWTATDSTEYFYDSLQRLAEIRIAGQKRFTYVYQKNGLLAKENFFVAGSSTPAEIYSHAYTAQDWVKRLTTQGTSPRFMSELAYDSLFNGNVSLARHTYQLSPTDRRVREYSFGYDGMDRLTEAQSPSDPNLAAYNYDAQGRLMNKKEGASDIPAYAYAPGTNQVTSLPGSTSKGNANTYVYDPEGNLVLDRSKNLVIDYDDQGLPETFRFYNSLPTQTLTWKDVDSNGLVTHFGKTETGHVEMEYDAFGQRVLKKFVTPTSQSWTAYAGQTAELTSSSATGPWTVSALNRWTPQGLRGRKEVGGAEYVYVTDAQGSVRMGISTSTGAIVDARDYMPYGQVDVLVGAAAGKARQGYTEKELDSETGLTYFGARYLDAEVGVWTATDPMGQYHNAYSFVGGNPVNLMDLWGLEGESGGNGSWEPSVWDVFQDRGGTWNGSSSGKVGGGSGPADASNVAIAPPIRFGEPPQLKMGPDRGNYRPDMFEEGRNNEAIQASVEAAKNTPEVIETAADVATLLPWGLPEALLLRMGRIGKWLLRANQAQKITRGIFKGSLTGLTAAERGFIEELISLGKNVEVIPRGAEKTADFLVNGISTELKTLTSAGNNTLKNAIETAAQQGKQIVIDARNVNISANQASIQIMRAQGNVGGLSGRVTVLTSEGTVTF